MYEFEPVICAFEAALNCRVTLHDPGHSLYLGEEPLVDPVRESHRRSFPDRCGRPPRSYCVRHCMDEFEAWMERSGRSVTVKRCRYGYLEASAVIRHQERRVLTLFAGLWRRDEIPANLRLLQRLLSVLGHGLLGEAEELHRRRGMSPGFKAVVTSCIDANYARRITTADLAERLGLSVPRVCHRIKSEFGCTFFELLTATRCFHARLFLINSDYRIGEIAELCGFGTAEHFSRSFKSATRMTPGAFRRKFQRRPAAAGS